MNKTTSISKLLGILENEAGNKIYYNDLKERLSSRSRKTRNDNNAKPKKKGRTRRDSSILVLDATSRSLLEQLSAIGMLVLQDSCLIPASPFALDTYLSVSKGGAGFALTMDGSDIFIAPRNRNSARHRDRVLIKLTGYSRKRFEGIVKDIITPFQSEFIARVEEETDKGYRVSLPDQPDTRFANLRYSSQLNPGSYVVAHDTGKTERIPVDDTRSRRKKMVEVPVLEFIDHCDTGLNSSDLTRVLLKHNLTAEYPQQAIPLKKELKKKAKAEMKSGTRRNLSSLYTITIDGHDAKDFDDAISVEIAENGYKLYVHIADVSFFVEAGSPLDEEARRRGNSYYLKPTVLPMLPEILSEEFCSLKPKSKRLSVTAEIHYDSDGKLLNFFFYRSQIYINKRFTYTEADESLNKKNSPLQLFWELAQKLLKRRLTEGRIDLNLKEIESVTDSHGRMVALIEKERLRSHRLIEEFMLSANICAASFSRQNKIPTLYRVHEPIPTDSLEKINEFLKIFGFRLQLKDLSYTEIRKALELVARSEVETIFNYLLLRSFTQAFYSPEPKGHWGLGFPDYAHFTSPIRRYADLVVHRQLISFLDNRKYDYQTGELTFIGTDISRLERIAMDAERDMKKLMSIRFMQNRTGDSFEAFFTGYKNDGLFINLIDPQIEGFIPVAEFSRDGEVINHDAFRILLPRFQKVVALGSKFEVELKKADWDNVQMVFSLKRLL